MYTTGQLWVLGSGFVTCQVFLIRIWVGINVRRADGTVDLNVGKDDEQQRRMR